jgi:hypothetical protein
MAVGILPRLIAAAAAAAVIEAVIEAVSPLLPSERNESNVGFIFMFYFLISDESLGCGLLSEGRPNTGLGIR